MSEGKLYHHKPHPHKPRNINQEHDERLSVGGRIADVFALTIGSWNFIIIQSVILALWIVLNSIAYFFHWDNYPYVLLNLMLSFEAAFSAPIIMMSQNRQSEKDRLMAQNDFETDQKAESHIEGLIGHLDAQDKELLLHTELLENHYKELCKQTEMLTTLLSSPPPTIRRKVRKQEVPE